MPTIAEILDTYRRGDRLDDDELERLRSKMQSVADALSGLGDLFALQQSYAMKVASDCRSFINARANK